ncbi:Xaa-Pro dipeptidyl-peptidase [Nakamurella silvestris]|nr:Xaa-Pro dipeptidyl-peptidase [Nakamurella silvestris]
MTRLRSRAALSILPVLGMTASLLFVPPSVASAATPVADPFVLVDGKTSPIYSYADAIREYVWVEAPFDGDLDGKKDLIRTDIIRPREAATAGLKVPVIMDPSPYHESAGRGNESQLKKYDEAGNATLFPLFLDNYFVPRGYAYVLPEVAGTNKSEGCVDIGGQYDVGSMKAAVDWLNGNAVAYRDKERTQPVLADWTTGATAAIGKSYDGALSNGLAATGVEGLKTIVPISGMSSQYDWYRYLGARYSNWYEPDGLANYVFNKTVQLPKCAASQAALVAGADAATGNYNSFWADRDYLANIDKFKASVFIAHGLNDLNVKMNGIGNYWEALGEAGIPRKIWLSQRAHADPFDVRRAEWVDTLHQWFDYWLLGVQNGIMEQPVADVESAPDVWTKYASWPAPGTKQQTLNFKEGSTARLGSLVTEPTTGAAAFTGANQSETTYSSSQAARADRLLYTSPTLTKPLHLSGIPSAKLRLTSTQPMTNLSFFVVDYGAGTRINTSTEGVITGTETDCWGEGTAIDTGCFKKTTARTATADYYVVTRGWLSTEHRNSLISPTPTPVGEYFDVDFEGLAHDYIFEPGHKLGIIIANNTSGRLLSVPLANFTLDLAASSITLPIVGSPVPEWAAASSTSVSVAAATVPAGTSHTATATVTSTAEVTGTVEFRVDGKPAGSAELVDGTATAQVTVPLGAHRLTAVYGGSDGVLTSTSEPVEVSTRFTDAGDENGQFYQDVMWLATQGITTGFEDGTFRPGQSIGRDAVVTFLYRITKPGQPLPICTTAPFKDVPTSHPLCGAIQWAKETGIASGWDDGTFRPAASISRDAIAALLYRQTHGTNVIPACTTRPFTDVTIGHPLCGAIAWAAEAGVTTGFPNGTFKPADPVQRQAVAAFLHRLYAD